MRKTQMALAAVALVASTAALAEVKVYGNLDGGYASGANSKFYGAGNNATTQFGITGSEDIGGGLKASFNLLSGINIAKGAMGDNGGGNTNLFNRGASVGVSNENVGITIGNQFSNVVAAAGFATGGNGVGGDGINVPAVVRLFGGAPGQIRQSIGGAAAGNTGFFISEAVQVSANVAGVSANVMYRMVDKNATNSSYLGLTASTSVSGINVAVGFQDAGYATSTDSYKSYFVAANTNFGDVRVNVAAADNSGRSTVKSSTYSLGASMPLVAGISGGISYANGTDTQGSQTGLALEYALSKQSKVYANYLTFSKAGGGAAIANDGNLTITGKSLTTVGLSHAF